jgi:hypothetical protein
MLKPLKFVPKEERHAMMEKLREVIDGMRETMGFSKFDMTIVCQEDPMLPVLHMAGCFVELGDMEKRSILKNRDRVCYVIYETTYDPGSHTEPPSEDFAETDRCTDVYDAARTVLSMFIDWAVSTWEEQRRIEGYKEDIEKIDKDLEKGH